MHDHSDDIFTDIQDLVRLETPSTDKQLLDQAVVWLRQRTEQVVGAPEDTKVFDGREYGDVLALTYGGTGDAVVTFLCHYDTVWDAGTLSDWPVTVEGDVAEGPGIFDMKAGCVQAIWALAAVRRSGLTTPTVHMLFTGDEEIGSEGSRDIIERYAALSDLVMVFEPSEKGRIKTQRKGTGRFFATVEGRAAHAGSHYEQGVSALDELARLTLALHGLTDLAAGTTVNVGVAHGGTRSNVVAALATAEIDVRVSRAAEMRRIDTALAEIRPHHPQARITLTEGWNRPPMERSELTTGPYRIARSVAALLDCELGEIAVGGISDGNFVAALGVPVLDGMGAIGGNPHARGEYISLSGSLERTAIAAGVLAALRVRHP
ncbi:M20 family metallopeptidase [Streptomyces spiralis]|uniref:M20 family metallopeptidase n=1 Tax=Streptomyces spiralis TaxID=66376 RepID=UPI001E36064C|nr:M20 family metallopeptidase [Streptomyces spiralis]